MIKTVIGKKHIVLTTVFAIYMSIYMICLIYIDKSSYELADAGIVLHYLKMPAFAAGILLFPLGQRLQTGKRARRVHLIATCIVFAAGLLIQTGLLFKPTLYVYIASCIIVLLSLGLLGGSVYYHFAMAFVNHPYLGRMSGIGGAAAFLIQVSAQNLFSLDTALLVLLLLGFAFAVYMSIISKERFEWMFDEPLEYAKQGDPSLPKTKVIITGILGMMLLYLMCGLTDVVIVSRNFAGDMSAYSWIRLFGAVGYLTGGFLADICRRKWLMISTLGITILSIPLPFMFKEGYFIPATCLFYIILVSQIELLNVFFWDLAPKTSHPQLFAGMSRVLSCLCEVMLPLFPGVSVMTALIIEVVLAVAVILCIAFGGYNPSLASKDEKPSDGSTSHFEDFASRHGLTPRETDFLRLLIDSDDEVAVMASNMNISTRTVYRHINSIYEKTGTETRYALMRYYYQSK